MHYKSNIICVILFDKKTNCFILYVFYLILIVFLDIFSLSHDQRKYIKDVLS